MNRHIQLPLGERIKLALCWEDQFKPVWVKIEKAERLPFKVMSFCSEALLDIKFKPIGDSDGPCTST